MYTSAQDICLFSSFIYLCDHWFISALTRGYLFHTLDYSPVVHYVFCCLSWSSFGLWELFQVGSLSLSFPNWGAVGRCPCVALPFATRRCSWLVFISCPSGISHFSKQLWFLLLENDIGNYDLFTRCAVCYWCVFPFKMNLGSDGFQSAVTAGQGERTQTRPLGGGLYCRLVRADEMGCVGVVVFGKYHLLRQWCSCAPRTLTVLKTFFIPVWLLFCFKETLSKVWLFPPPQFVYSWRWFRLIQGPVLTWSHLWESFPSEPSPGPFVGVHETVSAWR